MYADDSTIIGKMDSAENRQSVQLDIDNVVEWCTTWCMELNCKKCKIMYFGNSQVV
jgi:hypothetical protein